MNGTQQDSNPIIGGGIEGFISPLEALVIFELTQILTIVHTVAASTTPQNSPYSIPSVSLYILLIAIITWVQSFVVGIKSNPIWSFSYCIGAIIGLFVFFGYAHLNTIYPDMITDTFETIAIIAIGMVIRIYFAIGRK
jgi:hypothetical protein